MLNAVLLSATPDEQKLQFLRKVQWHYWAALSLIQRHFADDEAAVRLGLELVLRRKGVILDAQSRFRDAVRQTLSGADLDAWDRLARYRTELSRLLLSGPVDQTPAAWRK